MKPTKQPLQAPKIKPWASPAERLEAAGRPGAPSDPVMIIPVDHAIRSALYVLRAKYNFWMWPNTHFDQPGLYVSAGIGAMIVSYWEASAFDSMLFIEYMEQMLQGLGIARSKPHLSTEIDALAGDGPPWDQAP